MKSDLYQRITNRIVTDLEQGVRSWLKPWNASHMAGRISRPLRWSGQPYSGINVISLWAASVAKGYSAPIWMTFKQALELGSFVRKGEHGSLVVYVDPNSEDVRRQRLSVKLLTQCKTRQIY